MADIAIEDDKLGGQEYTFTAHLAPFCLDADD